MKISIIVPIYNTEKYLDRCLNSLINQTYNNIEIILVNDASSDRSLDICKKYEELDDRIILINKIENEGQVKAYTEGLRISNGEYIGFVDSDDWVANNMYEEMIKEAKKKSAEMVVCGVNKVYNNYQKKEPKEFSEYKNIYTKNEIKSYSYNNYSLNNPITNLIKYYRCNKIIKRDILVDNLEYTNSDIHIFEDNCLILPTILDASKIVGKIRQLSSKI